MKTRKGQRESKRERKIRNWVVSEMSILMQYLSLPNADYGLLSKLSPMNVTTSLSTNMHLNFVLQVFGVSRWHGITMVTHHRRHSWATECNVCSGRTG